jgi:long-chain acyl-CoA synthetase
LYTGGTSGLPKGVPLQHRHILANAMQVGLAWPPQPADLCLHVAPMFHSADLVMGCFTLQGAAHAYLPRFTPELLLQTIEKLRVTAVMMVPTMLLMVLDSGLLPRFDVSSLKRVLYGASPMSLEAITRVAAALPGVAFTQGYGLTETGPLLAMLDGDAHAQGLRGEQAQRLHSCGQPLAGVELKIVQADGQELPCGESGEIVVRGPNVVAAYLHAAPTAGADTPAQPGGDWFSTGDVGRQDSDGFLYVLDRKKDMIISGGENVYSAEVEAVLSAHPDVAEVAVIGVPDPLYGEAVLAVLVSRCAVRPDAQQLREFCLQRIGAYKVPRRFEFVDALPRSAMGKVLKTVLRMTWAAA